MEMSYRFGMLSWEAFSTPLMARRTFETAVRINSRVDKLFQPIQPVHYWVDQGACFLELLFERQDHGLGAMLLSSYSLNVVSNSCK